MRHPDSLRSVDPAAYPQYPFDRPPPSREASPPRYDVVSELGVPIGMRDDVKLYADVFRPYAPGQSFPALIAFSPYTRLLQSSVVRLGQNEAGVTEFWVPRGYAHVIVDARGTGDSEGAYDLLGREEQADVVELIEWVAEQSWCNGNVGMVGCSYFAMIQVLVAPHRPPSLKAIFPYDGATDIYREFYTRGGAPSPLWFQWISAICGLNVRGGRIPDPTGIIEHGRAHLRNDHPLVDAYWDERTSESRLERIDVPTYFGCDWTFQDLHLRGAFEGWERTGDIPKRLMIGPAPRPFRIFATYHGEALRWYDQWLKGMDTGVMDGDPIRLFIPGPDLWRGEQEWPLARTEWQSFFLSGARGLEGRLSREPGPDSSLSWEYDPHSYAILEGRPCLTYRSEPLEAPLEVTGPVALYVHFSSTAGDADVHARLCDEAPNGEVRLLCKGALRVSHRALDPERSRPWQPYHPHDEHRVLPPGETVELAIELWPTSNVFRAGNRIRLEVSSTDNLMRSTQGLVSRMPPVQLPGATNTVLGGGSHPSHLVLPVIPPG